MTAFNSKEGGFYLTTVGRVQTPTLAILVEREEKIRAFQPRDYWEVHARFGAKAGEYPGRWFDPAFKKDEDPERKTERIWTAERAEAIAAACAGKPGTATEETKPSTQASPLLYDLTSLQREANGRFGFSAKGTLGARAGAVRKAQGADLSADRRARAARGLRRHGQEDDGRARRCQGIRALRQAGAQGRLGQAEQADLRQQQDLRPLRHHPDAADARAT